MNRLSRSKSDKIRNQSKKPTVDENKVRNAENALTQSESKTNLPTVNTHYGWNEKLGYNSLNHSLSSSSKNNSSSLQQGSEAPVPPCKWAASQPGERVSALQRNESGSIFFRYTRKSSSWKGRIIDSTKDSFVFPCLQSIFYFSQ